MATETPASDALCRFSGRNSDTMAGLLERYLASEEIVSNDTTPDTQSQPLIDSLLRGRVAFSMLNQAQQISYMRRLAEEYAACQMTREHTPAPITTPTA
jgi:hypothetical protein